MLKFGEKEFMHAGISVGICKLEEIIGVKVWHFLANPLILQFIEIAIKCKMFSELKTVYLFSYACSFYEK